MKKALWGIILGITVSVSSFAQDDEMKTLFKKDTSNNEADSYGGYGAPFVGLTELHGQQSIIVGGKGAMIKNHKFAFGGIGTAVIGTKDFNVNITQFDSVGNTLKTAANATVDSTIAGKRSISMGYGGIFFEYILNYDHPIHVSFPVHFQVGGVKAGKSEDNLKVKSSSVFVVEPGVAFEFNFYKFFIPSLNVGYRYVTGSYSSQLSGFYGSLNFKFGYF